jgi:succinate dehydrogenase/fumarate reductase flavoprotein subunit
MKTDISRRSFLKGTAAAAAGAALASTPVMADDLLIAPAPEAAEAKHPWEIPPEPVAEADIKGTIETEVLIIGGGYSGCAAAASSAERGVQVILVEQNDALTGHGVGGTGSVGSKIIDELGGNEAMGLDKPYSVVQWLRACANRARESLVAKFFNESHRAMDWLIDLALADGGNVYLSACNSRSRHYPEQPAYHMVTGLKSSADLGWAAMSVGVPILLKKDAEEHGAQFDFKTKALYLEKDGDRVVGAICEKEDGYYRYKASLGVVLATGDISGDDEMTEYFAPIANKVYSKLYTPVGSNTGSGHKMGLWAGGSFQDGPWPCMLHPQACAGFHGPFLFVSPEGKRFMDEATWVQGKCLGVMLQAKAKYAWSIFDGHWKEDLLDSLPHGGGMFWDNFRMWGTSEQDAVDAFARQVEGAGNGTGTDGRNYFQADTLEELAKLIDVPEEEFLASVARYNEMCEAGEDVDFYKEPTFLYPIKEPPYHAAKVGPALLVIVGGLNISDNFEVLTPEDKPIPGLYATGNCSGNLYASDYPINIPGNSHGRCLTWGFLLGEQFEAMKKA